MRVWGHFGHPCLWGKNKHKKNVFDQAKKTDTFLKQKIWLQEICPRNKIIPGL